MRKAISALLSKSDFWRQKVTQFREPLVFLIFGFLSAVKPRKYGKLEKLELAILEDFGEFIFPRFWVRVLFLIPNFPDLEIWIRKLMNPKFPGGDRLIGWSKIWSTDHRPVIPDFNWRQTPRECGGFGVFLKFRHLAPFGATWRNLAPLGGIFFAPICSRIWQFSHECLRIWPFWKCETLSHFPKFHASVLHSCSRLTNSSSFPDFPVREFSAWKSCTQKCENYKGPLNNSGLFKYVFWKIISPEITICLKTGKLACNLWSKVGNSSKLIKSFQLRILGAKNVSVFRKSELVRILSSCPNLGIWKRKFSASKNCTQKC